MDNQSLSHSRYNCIYHIAFFPNIEKVMFGELRIDEIGDALDTIAEESGNLHNRLAACDRIFRRFKKRLRIRRRKWETFRLAASKGTLEVAVAEPPPNNKHNKDSEVSS